MNFRHLTPSERLTADISALADGSIRSDRREQVERQIAASEELRSLFEQEQGAARLLRQARERDRAPDPLRRRLAHERHARSTPGRRGPRALAGSLAGASAAAVAVTVLLLAGGPASGPSVAQAASLATRGAVAPGPPPDRADPSALRAGVGAVYFPNWNGTLGWSATGQRADQLARHRALTVYYSRHGMDVAYTIVSIPGLRQPHADLVATGGLHLRVLSLAGRHIVTWRRDGQTCILSSRSVGVQQLESLAAWS